MRLLDVYFKHCRDLFNSALTAEEHDPDFYFAVADRATVKVQFAGTSIREPFRRALAHLQCAPVDHPDLVIGVWDSSRSHEFTPPYPSWDREGHFAGQTLVQSDDVRVACEIKPNRLGMLNFESNQGLFWINDTQRFPWFEQCRPLRNILEWWFARKEMYLVHAACIGTAERGMLVVGNAGAGKSTIALSSLTSNAKYCGDDLCLIGLEDKIPFAYSLYNTGKLEHFDVLPHLEQFVWNPHRGETEKAVIFAAEVYPDKILKKTRISAIVYPRVSGIVNSELTPAMPRDVLRILARSTLEQMIGAGAADFLGLYKVCSGVPCYTLHSGTDFEQLHDLLNDQLFTNRELLQV